jgi:dTDP-4-dehydrorhamnose reductase
VRILVTGAGGQVGARVAAHLRHHDVVELSHTDLDLADREQVEQVVGTVAPDAVVNAAAMTNVDACERDPERAFAVNALGVRHLAIASERVGAHVVHISTDYVFDGESDRPYDEWDAVGPLSEYGRSKLGGERELAEHASSWATVRTSWVFGKRGTDLVSWAFGAYERGELNGVLAESRSIPTYALDLAELLAQFAVTRRTGLYHVTSGSEAVTRHELIVTALRLRGLDADGVAPITEIPDRPARRPAFSALDNRALRLEGESGLRPWRDALTEYVKDWPTHRAGTESGDWATDESEKT